MKFTKPEGIKLICLTPVVNEAFELDRFIQSASTWADYIILGYQESIDNTLEIAKSYDNVIIVNSPQKIGMSWPCVRYFMTRLEKLKRRNASFSTWMRTKSSAQILWIRQSGAPFCSCRKDR